MRRKATVKAFSPFFIEYTNNRTVFEVNGTTVLECLYDLMKQFPKLRLFEKNRKLIPYVEVSLNGVYCRPEALARPVKDGDEIQIFVVLAGG